MCVKLAVIEEKVACIPSLKRDIEDLKKTVYKAMGASWALSIVGTIVLKKLGVL